MTAAARLNSAETIRELLTAGADDDPAIIATDGSVISHRELRALLGRLRDGLHDFGVAATDRIAIVLPNGPTMAVAFLAAATTGCAAPLNPRYRSDELRFCLADLGAAVLITGTNGGSRARAAAGDGTLLLRLTGSNSELRLEIDRQVNVGNRVDAPVDGPGADMREPEPVSYDPAGPDPAGPDPAGPSPAGPDPAGPDPAGPDPAGPSPAGPSPANPDPDSIALVLHTSGTTSRPKIVPLRQRNLARSARGIAESLQLDARDRSYNVMPLFHIHGLLAGLLAPLSAGGSVICSQGSDAFRFFSDLHDLRPSYYTAVPTMHQMLLARAGRHGDAAAGSGLRFVRSSSASLPTPVLDELQRLFGVPVIEAYGMTEASHQMCANPLPPGVAKARSVGLPTGIELAILDDEGQILSTGRNGEVAVSGPTIIDGYENNPEADRAAFTSGWFRTGDEGYLDDDGYLFLTGRLKEQINRGGEKVSPLEVDEALLRHDDVTQAACFGAVHDKLGEEVFAAVVLSAGAEVTERELRDFVSQSLAAFKVPRRVLIVDELPKGPTGKLQRIGMAQRLGLSD